MSLHCCTRLGTELNSMRLRMMMLNARTKQAAHTESGWDGHAWVFLLVIHLSASLNEWPHPKPM